MKDQSERFGAEFMAKNVDTIDSGKEYLELTAGGTKYLARAVIVATGAETKWLGVPGEDKLRGRGVSSCAPCDAPFFKDKDVAVIGGWRFCYGRSLGSFKIFEVSDHSLSKRRI